MAVYRPVFSQAYDGAYDHKLGLGMLGSGKGAGFFIYTDSGLSNLFSLGMSIYSANLWVDKQYVTHNRSLLDKFFKYATIFADIKTHFNSILNMNEHTDLYLAPSYAFLGGNFHLKAGFRYMFTDRFGMNLEVAYPVFLLRQKSLSREGDFFNRPYLSLSFFITRHYIIRYW